MATEEIPIGFGKVAIPELKGYIFDEKTATYISRVIDTIGSNEAVAKFVKKLDKALDWWKVLATSVNPGFHARNFYSNHFLGWVWQGASYFNPKCASYFNPKWHRTATYFCKKAMYDKDVRVAKALNLKYTDKVLDTVFDHNTTYREVLEFIKKRGMARKDLRIIQVAREEGVARLHRTLKKTLQKLNPASTHSIVANTFEKVGSMVESEARIAAFLNEFHRIGDMEIAFDRMQRVMVDYVTRTPWERHVMKRVVPFWTWIKSNTVNQVKFIFIQPGRYSKIPKFRHAVEAGIPENKKVPEALKPPYFSDLWMWQLPITLPNGTPLFFNPNFPFQDLNRLSMNPEELGKNAMSVISPFIKVPIELIGERDIFYQRPLIRYPGYRAPVPGITQVLARTLYNANPTLTKKMGIEKKKDTMVMNPKAAKILEGLVPFINNYARALAITPSKENFDNIFQSISYLVGIKVKPLDLLGQEYYRLLRTIKARKKYAEERGYGI